MLASQYLLSLLHNANWTTHAARFENFSESKCLHACHSVCEQFSIEVEGWVSERVKRARASLSGAFSVMRLRGDKSLWDLTGCHIPRLRVLAAPLPWAQLSRAMLYRLLMLFPDRALCPLQFTHLPFHSSSVHLTGAIISAGCHNNCRSPRWQLNTLMCFFFLSKNPGTIFLWAYD